MIRRAIGVVSGDRARLGGARLGDRRNDDRGRRSSRLLDRSGSTVRSPRCSSPRSTRSRPDARGLADDGRDIAARLTTPARACRTARSRNRRHRHLSVVVDRVRLRRVRVRHTGRPAGWLGSSTVQVPIANDVPWPRAALDIRPVRLRRGGERVRDRSYVGPGLPLLMAAMKAVAGHAALFLVVPITAALLIWSTFGIGRQTRISPRARPRCGLARRDEPGVPHDDQGADERRARRGILGTRHVEGAGRFQIAREHACRRRRGDGDSHSPEPRAARRCARRVDAVAVEHDARRRDRLPLASSSSRYRSCLACLAIAWINQTLFGSPLASGYGSTGNSSRSRTC